MTVTNMYRLAEFKSVEELRSMVSMAITDRTIFVLVTESEEGETFTDLTFHSAEPKAEPLK